LVFPLRYWLISALPFILSCLWPIVARTRYYYRWFFSQAIDQEIFILYKAIFFDFDGVLVESLQVKIDAFRSLYAPHGREIEEKALAHYLANTGISRGIRITECHRAFLGRELSETEVRSLSDRFGELVEDRVVACAWVPGARAVLERWYRTLPLFVVSATPNEELARILERRGMAHYFAAAHGSPPDKITVIGRLLREHGWSGEQVLMVGDGPPDQRAAAANGVAFVGRLHRGYPNPFPDGTRTINNINDLTFDTEVSS
jgi:phosphoglycolate phosphatase-like HAD superfamily hydrolase